MNDSNKKVQFNNKINIVLCNLTAPSSSIDNSMQQLIPRNFDQNPSLTSVLHRLEEFSVAIETLSIKNFYLIGTVLVKNKSFNKSVRVRYTNDNWSSFQDTTAGYDSTFSTDIDRFQFKIDLLQKFYNYKIRYQNDLKIISSAISFALLYRVDTEEFWDNNNGQNYHIEFEYGIKMTYPRRVSPRSILVKKYDNIIPKRNTNSRENSPSRACSTEYNRMFVGVDVLLPSFF
jgi:protein phosphatase 1 regulatory subunit 3A/B/C/D/E